MVTLAQVDLFRTPRSSPAHRRRSSA